MQRTNFPNCCGIAVLNSFGNTSATLDTKPYSNEEVEKFLQGEELFEKTSYSFGRNAFQIVSLNDEQYDKLGETFHKQGFEVVGKNHHPKHNSTIYVLLKSLKYD